MTNGRNDTKTERGLSKQTCTTFLLVGVGWLWKGVTVVRAGGVFGVPLAWWEVFTVAVVVVLTVLFAGSALVWGSLSIFPQNLDTRSWNKVDRKCVKISTCQKSICKINFQLQLTVVVTHIISYIHMFKRSAYLSTTGR